MAEKEVNDLGVIEIAKRTNNGNVLTTSEVLSKNNEVLQDAVWVPANNLVSHVHSRRLSLPDGTWRKLNAGAEVTASQTKQIVENVGRLESWSRIDEATLSALLGDKVKFRNEEDAAFIMGLGQTFVETFLAGDTSVDPEKFDGLRVRLDATGTMVISCGGSGGDTTSVFLIQWGTDMCHMVYLPDEGHPSKGSPVKVADRGLQLVGTTTLYDAYHTKFSLTAGFACHDDRCLARLANIEDDAAGANIIEPDHLVQVLNEMLMRGKGSYMYCHQIVLTQLDILAMDKSNVLYNIGNLWGEPTTRFRTTPVRHLESIGITESVVS